MLVGILSSCHYPCPSPAPPPHPLLLQEQYVFIHCALREYLLLGYTMLPGSELKSNVEEMSPVKRHSGVSRFQEQYEVWWWLGRDKMGRGRQGVVKCASSGRPIIMAGCPAPPLPSPSFPSPPLLPPPASGVHHCSLHPATQSC